MRWVIGMGLVTLLCGCSSEDADQLTRVARKAVRKLEVAAGGSHGRLLSGYQAIRGAKGYGPPILPEIIVSNYHRIKLLDPTRPVLLNLGQCVAWDNYIGRGVRRNHPED